MAQVYRGGGAYGGILNNCLVVGNSAGSFGGGIAEGTLTNCTIIGNSAADGGGVWHSFLWTCIVYYNSAQYFANFDGYAMNYYCTTPLPPAGAGNFTNAPFFLNTNGWSNLRLQTNSPCINAGNNNYAGGSADLDGRLRIVDVNVDIGAYEYQPGVSGLFIGWLGDYGLPTDGSADYSDTDFEGMNNWQEWIAGTIPTNALSALRLLTPRVVGTNLAVSWQSVTNRTYLLQRSTGLGTSFPFVPLASNIVGQASNTTFIDTNIATGPRFYRVGVP